MGADESWDDVRRSLSLNEEHVAQYGRLGGIEEQLYALAKHRGVREQTIAAALGVDPEDAWTVGFTDDDLYVFALARHVAALGGHLELRAVFPDENVLLLREPEAGDGAAGSGAGAA